MIAYMGLALVSTIGMQLMASYFGNNLILVTAFGLFELLLFTVLYSKYMGMKRLRWLILVLALLGSSFICYELLTIDFFNTAEFQTYARVLDAFIIIMFSMIYFFDKLSKGTDLSNSAIVLNTTILVFFSLNLIFLLPINFLINEESQLKFYFWLTYITIISIFYLFVTYLIWKNGKRRRH